MGQIHIAEKIAALKKSRNALILAHNYQRPEIQDIADYTGDSLELSRRAERAKEDVIVFCGVYFMAQTAKILSPDKSVLIPCVDAGCPLADMITEDGLIALKKKNPLSAVVCYVNSTAEIKARSDICCTSANAVSVVKSLPQEEVIFVPDRNLGLYVNRFVDKRMILTNGHCPIHTRLTAEKVDKAMSLHPKAKFAAHPECLPEVLDRADEVCSTGGMLRYAAGADVRELIVGTETGMLHRLARENPGKRFYPASHSMICVNMKKTDLAAVHNCLEHMSHRVEVAPHRA